ncbi:MAG: creatininase family protein [Anaerolineae bacterium]|nr:creatininase family protein [Anaerolineae bacterium]
MRLETATWVEVERRLSAGNAVALLPVGAQEQHGPHLALATDTIMATGLAERLADQLDALLLPALPYGETWTTAGWKGTISISFNTLVALTTDIGAALAAHKVAALIIVNGHFGNSAPLEQAARALITQHNLPTMILNYPSIEQAAAAVCESTPAAPGFYHADEVETSVVLALRPDAVQMEQAQPEYPQFPPTFGATPTQLDTFNRSGVFGDPRPATAAKGEQLLTLLTASALNVIRAFLAEQSR